MGRIVLRKINVLEIATGAEEKNCAVAIEGDKIAEVCKNDELFPNPGDKDFDFDDCWLIPGLVDMHVHVTFPYDYETPDYYTNPKRILEVATSNLSELRQIGVTACRDMGSYHHSAEWVKEVLLGRGFPTLFTCGEVLTYEKGHLCKFGRELINFSDVEVAVQQNNHSGANFIKVASDPMDCEAALRKPNPAFSQSMLSSIMSSAYKCGMLCACHTYPSEEGVMRALRAGIRTIEHAVAFSDEYGKEYFPQAYYVPTLATAVDVCGFEYFVDKAIVQNSSCLELARKIQSNVPFPFDIPPSILDWIGKLLKYLPNNIENNENICTGSDAGCKGTDFKSCLREIFLLSALGASNHQVLSYAITNPYKALALQWNGHIQQGFFADLVILPDNPLKHIDTLESNLAVVCKGNIMIK